MASRTVTSASAQPLMKSPFYITDHGPAKRDKIKLCKIWMLLFAAAPYTGLSKHGDNMPLIIILTVSIIGMILLGLNVLLILFFIRRRRKKMEKGRNFTSIFVWEIRCEI